MRPILLCALVFSGAFAADTLGTVTVKSGSVTLQSGSSSPRRISGKADVVEGDLIVTGDGASAVFTMPSGSVINVGPDSKLRVNKNTVKSEGNHFSVGVLSGSISARVAKLKGSSDSFSVYTPSAVAGIRGTDFSVATGRDGTAQVQVSEGLVQVSRPDGSSAAVAQNQKTKSDLSGTPLKTENGNDDVASWLAQRDASSKSNAVGTVNGMSAFLSNQTATAQAQAASVESNAQASANPTNKDQLRKSKDEALQNQVYLLLSRTASESIAANAQAVVSNAPNQAEAAQALNGLQRIQKSYDDAVARMDAALARLDAKLEAAYKRLDAGYNRGADRINDRMKGDSRFQKFEDRSKSSNR